LILSRHKPFGGPVRATLRSGAAALRTGFHLEAGMRVGLYGGSFNPAHDGHAHVAETARKRLALDKVIWLVSPQNPLKSSRDTAPLAERMAGVRRQARDRGMVVSDVETRMGSQYTIDTVRALKARYPGVKFVWVMGADSLATFHRWKGWTQIMREVPVAVISRPWASLRSRFSPTARRVAAARRPAAEAALLPDRAAPAWVYLHGPLNFASSTALREGRHKGGK
jgi:nicotinate-nucleotide adenylyltransferase